MAPALARLAATAAHDWHRPAKARAQPQNPRVRLGAAAQTRVYRALKMSSDEMKRKSALAALAHVPEQGVLGLGTGSTTRFFIEAVGELVRAGRQLQALPTSVASRALAGQCGIPLLDDAGPWRIDVCVDGADEVSSQLYLIKGGGGAHTREKIVNFASRLNVIIVDETKLVEHLGQTRRLPIEVLPFGHHTTLQSLRA